jgi:hypothetical protein
LPQALARELMEEVSVAAEIAAFNRHVEVIAHEGSRIRAAFRHRFARWTRGATP